MLPSGALEQPALDATLIMSEVDLHSSVSKLQRDELDKLVRTLVLQPDLALDFWTLAHVSTRLQDLSPYDS